MRVIEPLNLPDVDRAAITGAPPVARLVSPTSLYVDESYQRGLSERGVKLIRKIVAEWDWHAYKPPVVVDVEGRYEVIDGQHTAIAAVTHGGIAELPVLIVDAEARADKARAFVRHNRDRIQVTPIQLHTAMVAAGDEDAQTIAQVCDRAGVRILKVPPALGRYSVGDTMAISTIRALVNRRHAMGARQVLETCVKGGCVPVSAAFIKAVEHLLFAAEYKGELEPGRIAQIIAATQSTLQLEADRFATEKKVPGWRALASVIYMNRRKARANAT